MKKSAREKLIDNAESFAAGCNRSRLELRLVDEIRKAEKELAALRADVLREAVVTDTWYRAILTKNYKHSFADQLWIETGSLRELREHTKGVPCRIEVAHLYEIWDEWTEFDPDA